MAENKVAVEISLEERAVLAGLTKIVNQVNKTEDSFTKMSKTADKELGVLGQLTDGVSGGFKSLVGGVTVANLASEAIIGTANAIKNFVLGSVNAAVEQENAINRLNQSLRASGSYSQEASQDFINFASALQKTSIYGDEVVIGQIAVAKSFGASNEKAKELVQAAANLAATFGGSLESNVEKLGKTLSGSSGRLAQFIPELKNLTEEQLKAGKATEIINSKFSGAAANELNTYAGRITAMKNAVSDFQEELGLFVTGSNAVGGATKFLTDIFQRMTDNMAKARAESEANNKTFVDSEAKVNMLSERYAMLTGQLEKYQAITEQAGRGGFDLRTINDAKSQIGQLSNELNRLQAQIDKSTQYVAQAKPAGEDIGRLPSGGVSESDQKMIDSRKAAYAQLELSRAEYNARQVEQSVLETQITDENYAFELERLMSAEQMKIDALYAAEEQKATLITDATSRNLALKKIEVDKELALDKSKVDSKKKIDQQMLMMEQQKQTMMASFMSAGANLAAAIAKDGSKEQFAIQKAASIAQAWVATNTAMTQALALPLPPPAPQALAAQYKLLGAMNIAAIAATAIKGFAYGGIVGGNRITGDMIPARVNSGEMILNRQQQTELFRVANGGGENSGLKESIDRLVNAISTQAIQVNLDGRKIAESVRSQVQSGFRLA